MTATGAYSGGCQYGAVRFRAERLGRASLCHCRMCQKAFAGIISSQHPDHDTAAWPEERSTP